MSINKGRLRKHNIDIMFLMVLFLIFTFSAVSVLLMAVNSYRSVVYANEDNANARTAVAYVREQIRQHDRGASVELSDLDGIEAIKIAEDDEVSLYIYYYDGCLMELEAKDGSGVTADFGNKILEIQGMSYSWKNNQLLQIDIIDASGKEQTVDVAIKSTINIKEEAAENEEDEEAISEEEYMEASETEVMLIEE